MYKGKRLFGDPGGARPVPGPRPVGPMGVKAPVPVGELPRQAQPPGASAGYVFLCSRSAQADSLRLGILGAPVKELGQMKRCITAETQLFLFNIETFKLLGRFKATSVPDRDLAPGAFGGACGAQVLALPLDLSLMEVAVEDWVLPGPRSAADVQALIARLRKGQVAPVQAQVAEAEPQEASQPPQKKLRREQHGGAGPSNERHDLGPSICWDQAKGSCPRGLQCRFCHGYVFSCNNATQQECQDRRLFGAPERDMAVIRACVREGSELLLFNFESCRLFGPFVAASAPGPRLVKEAFGGKFSAHVRAAPLPGAPLLEATLESRVPGGPKTAAELEKFKELLAERGKAVEDDVQLAWSAEAAKEVKEEPVEDADSMLCWDFAKGRCPRGAKCRYLHIEGEAAGYVFLCSSKTLPDCGAFRLMGSPARELRQMQHCIKPDTQLFLLNFETLALIGPFTGISTPELDINHQAFDGKFSAQICVEPLEAPLLQAKLPERLRAGPKSAAELEQLREQLAAGGVAPDEIQDTWMKVEAT